MADHDHSYRLLFANPRMVEDLLQGFVHETWVHDVDFSTLERVAGTYVAEDLREREDDIVWRVRRRGEWVYVYLLLEFQSRVDTYMAVRMLAYVALLWQDLIKAEQMLSNGKLPPVFPVVLYNGKTRWTATAEIDDLIERLPGGLDAYSPRMRHLVIDEGAFDHATLAPLKNLVAVLFRLEQVRTVRDIVKVMGSKASWPSGACCRGRFGAGSGRTP